MAMKDYYEILGVNETASKAEIKKAYFVLVRQYPPEKEPEKFKEYRSAYETLFDDSSRNEYDSIKNIPEEYREVFDYSLEMMASGGYDTAINGFKRIVQEYPDLLFVNSMLAEAYSKNGNTGNAVKILEKIVNLAPDNMAYQKALADAYIDRGFNKKALKQYQKTLKLEPDNLELYTVIINLHLNSNQYRLAHENLMAGFQCAKKHGLDNTGLLVLEVFFYILEKNTHELTMCLEKIANKMAEEPFRKEAIAVLLFQQMFNVRLRYECMDGYLQTVNFIVEHVPELKEAQFMQREFKQLKMMLALKRDEKVPNILKSMTEIILNDCDCPSCKVDKLFMELNILEDMIEISHDLRYLHRNYPEAFALNADFYNNVLNVKKEKWLFDKLRRKYKQYKKQYPEEFEEEWKEYDDKPFIRNEKKIGRNDPCPCGSGKKYKKCCGAE